MLEIHKSLSSKLKKIPDSKDFQFGRHFSDHWFVTRFSETRGWYQADVEPYGTLKLDPAASVLHYGQALFEGMKAFRRKDGSVGLFRPEYNYHRMCEGAERLCLVPPPKDLFMAGLRELLETDERWVPDDPACSLYIRPTLIGVEPFLGVRPSREVLFYILLSPAGYYYSEGAAALKIWVEDKSLRAAPGGLGHTKAGANYAASLQSALAAKQKGYAQVLWLDVEHKNIEEVGTMNVFFVFKDEVVTPALDGTILAGGVRDSLIHWLKANGKTKMSERKLTIDEVYERGAKGELLEAFGTGTAAVISPIGELSYKGKTLPINGGQPGPLAKELFDTISGIQRGLKPDPFGWMVALKDLK